MKTITVDISERKALVFTVEDCDLRNVTLPFLVATLGEPLYVIKEPTDGEVGSPRREITVEPVQMRTAEVRVLGAAEVPTDVTLSPTAVGVSPGGTVEITASLDVPAPAGGTTIALAVDPTTAGTLPASVVVPADQTSATFTFSNALTTGSATITATAPGYTAGSQSVQVGATLNFSPSTVTMSFSPSATGSRSTKRDGLQSHPPQLRAGGKALPVQSDRDEQRHRCAAVRADGDRPAAGG